MSSYTNDPSPKAIELMKREQNIKFVDYCPSCDKWMKTTHNSNLFTQYTCETCNRIRKVDSLFITRNKEVTQQFLI